MPRIVVVYSRSKDGHVGDRVFEEIRTSFSDLDVSRNQPHADAKAKKAIRAQIKDCVMMVAIARGSLYRGWEVDHARRYDRPVIRVAADSRPLFNFGDTHLVRSGNEFGADMGRVKKHIGKILKPTDYSLAQFVFCAAALGAASLYLQPAPNPPWQPLPDNSYVPAAPETKTQILDPSQGIRMAIEAGTAVSLALSQGNMSQSAQDVEALKGQYIQAIRLLTEVPFNDVVAIVNRTIRDERKRNNNYRANVASLVFAHVRELSINPGITSGLWLNQLAQITL